MNCALTLRPDGYLHVQSGVGNLGTHSVIDLARVAAEGITAAAYALKLLGFALARRVGAVLRLAPWTLLGATLIGGIGLAGLGLLTVTFPFFSTRWMIERARSTYSSPSLSRPIAYTSSSSLMASKRFSSALTSSTVVGRSPSTGTSVRCRTGNGV